MLWSDGRKSWLKECNFPKKMKEILRSGKVYSVTSSDIVEFGQTRSELQLQTVDNGSEKNIVQR